MASSTSSILPLSYCPAITDEEFNLFHSIDRKLYSLLICHLGRDPAESMQVMALWLWLERAGHDNRLIKKMLALPGTVLNALADDTVKCLKCIDNDQFPIHDHDDLEGNYDNNISTLQSLIKNNNISLRYFHENRIGIHRGVTKIVNDVCARAFEDIIMRPQNVFQVGKGEQDMNMAVGGGYCNPVITSLSFCPGINIGAISHMGFNVPPLIWPNHGHFLDRIYDGVPSNILPRVHNYDPYDLVIQRQFLNNEIGDLLSRINIDVVEEGKEVPPDDRTIFLTFSKGYPISESEVRDFFTRKFGDFFEDIFMQEVGADKQVLYARLVARSVSIVNVVLDGESKAKFSINGKHVWARKYVKKQYPKSPPQPTSPVAVPQP